MLRLAPEQNALIAEHGRDVIAVLDEAHRIQFVSPAIQRQLGLSQESWAGSCLPELFPEPSRIEVEALLLDGSSQGEEVCQAELLDGEGRARHMYFVVEQDRELVLARRRRDDVGARVGPVLLHHIKLVAVRGRLQRGEEL